MSSMNTAMPYSESVSMNRNTPKAKSSPKRRYKPKPSVNKNQPPLEKPNFNSRTGKLVEVLYGRRHCSNSSGDLALLCTYFVANKRYIIRNHRELLFSIPYFMCQERLRKPGWGRRLSHNFQKTFNKYVYSCNFVFNNVKFFKIRTWG